MTDFAARPMDAKAAEEFYLRTFAEPTFEVNGIESGSPQLQKTVLPVVAVANVSTRLVAGQDPDRIAEVVERLLREAAPAGTELEIERLSASPPGLVSPDAPAIKLGQTAFERVVGRKPVLIRTGGTIPLVPALSAKGIPAIVTGFSLPDSQMHSPNERLVADYVPLGIATASELYRELAAL